MTKLALKIMRRSKIIAQHMNTTYALLFDERKALNARKSAKIESFYTEDFKTFQPKNILEQIVHHSVSLNSLPPRNNDFFHKVSTTYNHRSSLAFDEYKEKDSDKFYKNGLYSVFQLTPLKRDVLFESSSEQKIDFTKNYTIQEQKAYMLFIDALDNFDLLDDHLDNVTEIVLGKFSNINRVTNMVKNRILRVIQISTLCSIHEEYLKNKEMYSNDGLLDWMLPILSQSVLETMQKIPFDQVLQVMPGVEQFMSTLTEKSKKS